jgi:hypothetical protein
MFPIKIMDGKDRKEISSIIVADSDPSYNAAWSWKNEKGEKFSKENIVYC